MKTNDADWVDDVRRWCFSGGRTVVAQVIAPEVRPLPVQAIDSIRVGGYADVDRDATQPNLRSATWPKAVSSGHAPLA